MTLESKLAGVWDLYHWAFTSMLELPIPEDGSEDSSVTDFLHQETAPELGEPEAVSGSSLIIREDDTYQQTGTASAPLLTYDSKGIQISGIAEFGGFVKHEGNRSYLFCPDVPAWATPKDSVAKGRLRYDDRVTKICDFLVLKDRHLVRTMNVVTDGQYAESIVLFYTARLAAVHRSDARQLTAVLKSDSCGA